MVEFKAGEDTLEHRGVEDVPPRVSCHHACHMPRTSGETAFGDRPLASSDGPGQIYHEIDRSQTQFEFRLEGAMEGAMEGTPTGIGAGLQSRPAGLKSRPAGLKSRPAGLKSRPGRRAAHASLMRVRSGGAASASCARQFRRRPQQGSGRSRRRGRRPGPDNRCTVEPPGDG